MPFFADTPQAPWRPCGALTRAASAAFCAWALAASVQPACAQEAVKQPAVDQAAAQLANDPNMPGQRSEKTWRLKAQDEKEKPKPKAAQDWGEWLNGLAEASRWLVWLLGAAVLVIVLMRLARIARMHSDAQQARAALHPEEVGRLDIRPESLPDDIGAAARVLWEQGATHEAMTLLYRGALSRLVHRHGVPIRASSTEGDCLRLAEAHLSADRLPYVQGLTRIWMGVAYGHAQLSAEQALPLFAQFGPQLGQGSGEATS